MGRIVVIGILVVVIFGLGFSIHTSRQVSGLWEEFRSTWEDCEAPMRFNFSGECTVPTDDFGKPLFVIPVKKTRGASSILKERDKILNDHHACKIGGWYHSKFTGEEPVAYSTVLYYPCLNPEKYNLGEVTYGE